MLPLGKDNDDIEKQMFFCLRERCSWFFDAEESWLEDYLVEGLSDELYLNIAGEPRHPEAIAKISAHLPAIVARREDELEFPSELEKEILTSLNELDERIISHLQELTAKNADESFVKRFNEQIRTGNFKFLFEEVYGRLAEATSYSYPNALSAVWKTLVNLVIPEEAYTFGLYKYYKNGDIEFYYRLTSDKELDVQYDYIDSIVRNYPDDISELRNELEQLLSNRRYFEQKVRFQAALNYLNDITG